MRALALVIAGGIILMTVGYNEREALTSGTGLDAVRLTDPVTGAGLLTTNTDPNVTGVDPLTGEESPLGMDTGFGAPIRSYLATGLINGDLVSPPPNPEWPLNGDPSDAWYNPLPGWFYRQEGTSVTARWSDGAVIFEVAAGDATGDRAYLEQYAPVTQKGRNGTSHILSAQLAESLPDDLVIAEAQYLTAAGVETGTAGTDWSVVDRTWSVAANGETGMPSDADRLRVRVGIQDDYTDAATYTLQHAFVEQRWSLPGSIYYADWSTSPYDLTEDIAAANVYAVMSLGGSNRTLRSISSSGVRVGRILWIYNMDRTYSITISDNDGAVGTAQDRIYCPGIANLTLHPQDSVMLMYFGRDDDSARRWRVMGQV